ncbi:type II secretion system protein [bacterium]|nr:type II secretion system protein [bacterium]
MPSSIWNLLNQCFGKEKAFTLAEVLITLVIIGVIAAITIPSLINKTNNQETVSRLKKAYSSLSQATNLIILEEGPVTSWATSLDNIYNLYMKKLINTKKCNREIGCFEQGTIHWLSSRTEDFNSSTWRKFVLQDGSQILIAPQLSQNCTLDNEVNDGSKNHCARIVVDINGAKKPNTFGRDIFMFVLKKDGLYPAGCDYDNQCNNNSCGSACTCKVLREGAMNY